MLPVQCLAASLLLITLTGCSKDTDNDEPNAEANEETNSDAEWEELGEDGSSDADDDYDDKEDDDWDDWDDKEEDDTGKESGSCDDEVAEGAPCEGSWEETFCYDDAGVPWWCEGGVWSSDKDS